MNDYFRCRPRPVFDFFTSIEGESVFHIETPSAATLSLRRVLDAAHPHAAQWLVAYLQSRYKPHGKRQPCKAAMAEYLTWLDEEQIGLMQARPGDLARYLNGKTSQYPAATLHRHLAVIRGFYQYLNGRI